MLVAQKAAAKDEPSVSDMFEVGCVSTILQMLKLPDGTVKVLVEGQQRARVNHIEDGEQHFTANVTPVESAETRRRSPAEIEALRRAVMQQFDQYVKLNKKIPPEILTSISSIDDPGRLADTIAAHLPLKLDNKQVVLDLADVKAAPGKPVRADRARGRHPERRQEDPRPREAPDGKEPARLLPERAGQGDPEGTGRGRRGRRHRGDREEDQSRQDAQGRQEEGRRRAEEAQADVADVGRGHGGAQLHRRADRPALDQEDQDQARPGARRGRAQRRPLRPGQGQGPHPRIPRGAAARGQGQGADPVPGRPSGRRQDLAGAVDRQGDRPQVRAHGPGRHARRGRDPRPSPHLHRRAAGQGAAAA